MAAGVALHSLTATRSYSIAPIVVEVGQPAELFYLSESKLRSSSDFFDTALKKEWQEGQERRVQLPDEDPEIFNVYANWVMSGKLYTEDEDGVLRRDGQAIPMLSKLYILGDTLLDTVLKDRVTDALAAIFSIECQGIRWLAGAKIRDLIYSKTVPGASLRKMVVSQLACIGNVGDIISAEDPKELLLELALESGKGKPQRWEVFKAEVQKCTFHEHAPGAEHCYRNRRT